MPIPEPQYRNSAGRLLAFIGSIPANNSLLETLPPLIGQTPKSNQEKQQLGLMALMELHKVYLEFRQDMMDADINEKQREVLLKGLGSIEQSIYPMQLNGGMRQVTEAEISLLNVCATVIPEDGQVTKDDIEKIRESIAELRKVVEIGDISPTLRKALLELIRLSEESISRFNIHGARGLKKAFKAMLAESAELYGMTASNADAEPIRNSPIWATIVNHLKLFDSIASRLMKYKPLLEAGAQILIGGPA